MVISNTMKKGVAFLLLCMLMAVGMGVFSPIKAYASSEESTTGQIGDVNVTITDSGQLTVKGGGITNSGSSSSAWNNLILKYRNFIVGVSGVALVTMVLVFVFLLSKLATTSGNPGERTKVISGLIYSGIAVAGLGIVTTVVGIFYNIFK